MANADGGLIVVGAQTEKEESWLEERVAEVVPVPENLLNVQQHLDAILAWTFPPIGHRVRPGLFRRSDSKGILAIEIERAPDDEQPIMVRTLTDGGGDINAFAIARRYGTATEWVSGAQVWADIRDGRLARRNLQLPPGSHSNQDAAARIRERLNELEALLDAQGQDSGPSFHRGEKVTILVDPTDSSHASLRGVSNQATWTVLAAWWLLACGIGACVYGFVWWRRAELMRSALSSGPWRSSRASTKLTDGKQIVTLWTNEPSVPRFKRAGASRKSRLSRGALDETVSWAGDLERHVVVRATGSSAVLRLQRLITKEA